MPRFSKTGSLTLVLIVTGIIDTSSMIYAILVIIVIPVWKGVFQKKLQQAQWDHDKEIYIKDIQEANGQLNSRLKEFKKCWVDSNKLVDDVELKMGLSEKGKKILDITVANERLLNQDIADEARDIAGRTEELTRKYRTVLGDKGR